MISAHDRAAAAKNLPTVSAESPLLAFNCVAFVRRALLVCGAKATALDADATKRAQVRLSLTIFYCSLLLWLCRRLMLDA